MMDIRTEKIKVGELEAVLKYGISAKGVRDEYVRVFLDTSIGCGLGCDYCWVAKKKIVFDGKAERDLDELILSKLRWNTKYGLKLMGQGEPLLYPERVMRRFSETYLSPFGEHPKPESISGSTIFPEKTYRDNWGNMRKLMMKADKLYLSVVDPDPETRKRIVPAAMPLREALKLISGNRHCGTSKLHFTPTLSNSSHEKLLLLKELYREFGYPFRLIRQHTKNNTAEVDTVKVAEQMVDLGIETEVCISAGVGNETACGMFG
jgi:hypothetical protein